MQDTKNSITAWKKFSTYLLIDRKLSRTPKNVRALKSRFKKLYLYFEGKTFNRRNFNQLISSCMSRYSISYINNLIKIAKHYDKYLKLNCLDDYSFFHENHHQIKDTLSFAEMDSLANCDMVYRINNTEINLRHKCMILLLSLTGMRIGELLNIDWSDLVMVGEMPTVTLRDTKNGEDRTNVITPSLWQLLASLPKKNLKVFSIATEWGFKNDLKKRASKCHIEKNIYPHLFRASFVTEMRRQGATYEQIAPITGHKDINIMKKHYDQVKLSDIETTLFTFNSFFQDSQTFEMLSDRIRETVRKMAGKYNVEINEANKRLTITLSD